MHFVSLLQISKIIFLEQYPIKQAPTLYSNISTQKGQKGLLFKAILRKVWQQTQSSIIVWRSTTVLTSSLTRKAGSSQRRRSVQLSTLLICPEKHSTKVYL